VAPPLIDPVEVEGSERAVRWEYKPSEPIPWIRHVVVIKMDKSHFAEGGMRKAFHLRDLSTGENLVGKISHLKKQIRERYFEEARMQAYCVQMASRYNALNPPKQVSFITSYVYELFDRPDKTVLSAEPFVAGKFEKYNNNTGKTLSGNK
jgi:hypothetical protein